MGTICESAEAGRSQLTVMPGIRTTLQALGASHGSVFGHIRYALGRSVVLGLLKLRSRHKSEWLDSAHRCRCQQKAVANYFPRPGQEDRIPMTQMKIQKLVYYRAWLASGVARSAP